MIQRVIQLVKQAQTEAPPSQLFIERFERAYALEKLEQAINLGRRSQRIVKQNITFAISFIVLLLVANFVGNITMPFGVIGHEGSTVLVTLSGLRLLRN